MSCTHECPQSNGSTVRIVQLVYNQSISLNWLDNKKKIVRSVFDVIQQVAPENEYFGYWNSSNYSGMPAEQLDFDRYTHPFRIYCVCFFLLNSCTIDGFKLMYCALIGHHRVEYTRINHTVSPPKSDIINFCDSRVSSSVRARTLTATEFTTLTLYPNTRRMSNVRGH